MPTFIIEREIAGADRLSANELKEISAKSNEVLAGMGSRAKWQQSYVTDDKIFCVYVADDEAAVLEHAKLGGFPANAVHEVASVIDPSTGE